MKKIIGIGVVVVISMIVSAVLFAAEPPRFNAQGRGAGFITVDSFRRYFFAEKIKKNIDNREFPLYHIQKRFCNGDDSGFN